jgi:hypothetical protein
MSPGDGAAPVRPLGSTDCHRLNLSDSAPSGSNSVLSHDCDREEPNGLQALPPFVLGFPALAPWRFASGRLSALKYATAFFSVESGELQKKTDTSSHCSSVPGTVCYLWFGSIAFDKWRCQQPRGRYSIWRRTHSHSTEDKYL